MNSQKYIRHLTPSDRLIYHYPAETPSNNRECIVEIGPGRGDFLFHLAETHPQRLIYGIEIKPKRFFKLIRRRDNRRLTNIKLVWADAAYALPRLSLKNRIGEIYINFPDPWPKKRHAKHRLLKRSFLADCSKALTPAGTLFITTDVASYAEDTFTECRRIPQLRPIYDEPITTAPPEAFPTLFAEKWKNEGRTIYYQKFVRSSSKIEQL